MRRLPLLPTLFTAIAVLTMIGFGFWQLERREWKHRLIAQLEAARTLPPVTPREFFQAMVGEGSVQYRRAVVTCRPGRVEPYDLRGGASATGASGFLVLVSCRPPGRYAKGPDIVVVAGFSPRASVPPLMIDTEFEGTIIQRPYDDEPGRPAFMLIPTKAVAPLVPSRVPVPGDLPDSHLNYAFQWFAFATTLAVIYGLWLRRYLALPSRPKPGPMISQG